MGGVSGYSVETVFVSQCRKKLWRNPSMFQKISSAGKNLWRREGGYYFFRRKFFVSQCRKISWGTIQCFKKMWFRKNLCIRRANHFSPLNLFGLTVLKKICPSNKFWYRKISYIGRGHHSFVENFLFHMTEKLRKGSLLCFRKFLESKSFMLKRGGEGGSITTFRRNCFVLQYYSAETFPRGTLLCFGKFPVSKNIMDKRGISQFSVGNLLFHNSEKLHRGTL